MQNIRVGPQQQKQLPDAASNSNGETVVFLRDEHAKNSNSNNKPESSDDAEKRKIVRHTGSVKLKDLMDDFCVSAVVECDPEGNALPRQMLKTNPQEVLHRGRHYITRRAGHTNAPRKEQQSAAVTFRDHLVEVAAPSMSDGESLVRTSPSMPLAEVSPNDQSAAPAAAGGNGLGAKRKRVALGGHDGKDFVFRKPYTYTNELTNEMTFVTLEHLQAESAQRQAAEGGRQAEEIKRHQNALTQIQKARELLERIAV